jgi:hypothetical protein
MGSKSKKVVKLLWILSFLVAFYWSGQDSFAVFFATSRHPQISRSTPDLIEPARTEFKRGEQKFFLSYGIYVPLDDIMFTEQLATHGNKFTEVIERTCSGVSVGRGIAVWLPLKIKIPFFGERVSEWCWRPQVQRIK